MGLWLLEGEQLEKGSPPFTSSSHRNAGLGLHMGISILVHPGSLFPRKMGAPSRPQAGRLSAHTCTLSHTCNTYPYVCARPGCGVGKGTQTPFSLDKLKTQRGSFLLYLRKKKHSLQKERQLDRASTWAALSSPG